MARTTSILSNKVALNPSRSGRSFERTRANARVAKLLYEEIQDPDRY